MINSLIVTHSRTASGICSTIEMFIGIGKVKYIDAYVNGPEDDPTNKIIAFIESVKPGEMAYIFTDIYGGSVNQIVVAQVIKSKKNITVISNVNVPIVIELMLRNEELSKEKLEEIIANSSPMLVDTANLETQDDNFF